MLQNVSLIGVSSQVAVGLMLVIKHASKKLCQLHFNRIPITINKQLRVFLIQHPLRIQVRPCPAVLPCVRRSHSGARAAAAEWQRGGRMEEPCGLKGSQ